MLSDHHLRLRRWRGPRDGQWASATSAIADSVASSPQSLARTDMLSITVATYRAACIRRQPGRRVADAHV